jgi:hypothetical protein
MLKLGAAGRFTTADGHDEHFAALREAVAAAEQVPYTDCTEHPFGAVDEDAPDRCLLCHTRRRRGELARQEQVRRIPGGRHY